MLTKAEDKLLDLLLDKDFGDEDPFSKMEVRHIYYSLKTDEEKQMLADFMENNPNCTRTQIMLVFLDIVMRGERVEKEFKQLNPDIK